MRCSAMLILLPCGLFFGGLACADESGWTSLFDGKTLAGWKSYAGGPVGSQWVVDDGAIHLAAGGGGNIVTEKEFGDFEFQFQWKVAPGANSGVMYRVRPGDKAPYLSGPEYQVLDDTRHRDGGNPKTSAAALYGLIAGTGKQVMPVGEWNSGKIVVKGNHVEHWLNGRKVVEADFGTDAWRTLIAGSKFKDWPQFAAAPRGMICLQDHGDKVWFRDLKIRPLAKPVFTDPAHTDPAFPLQGEYAGTLTVNGQPLTFGVQVVALGNGAFSAVGYPGGLPGAGWTPPHKATGHGSTTEGGNEVSLHGVDWGGTARKAMIRIIGDTPTVVVLGDDGGEIGRLPKVVRTSPTLGQKPPNNAVVIFDGTSTDRFIDARMTDDGLLMEGVTTKDAFGDAVWHIEFRLPYQPEDRGQGRGNSGAYLQGCYEVQMLDSFGLEGKNNECGGIYSVAAPAVNMCLPPLAWQTYDIEFTAPKFDGDKKVADARMTVRHNGVLIHENVAVPKITPSGPRKQEQPTGPLYLQNHRNPVRYRNIWVLPKS